ncbi:acyl-CoA carboxylase epsilon subunit [Streptomyces albireticuli]|uniref:Acyl-CoA carboxylase subunit epsilon n=1 Tax=Streptomyces albireticuli TaxID=1940 RepID=A0A2A2D993_9ACTN|nr:acyl-CoA carboxylase epsilon subunit [Streptomyces albireticuli]MCD9193527.1 acyl-CoA carboxylase subunit epsilon [Streptomyces albireticuli]PAU48017.1 hypothetical protein CK936_15600 [Streptomyces albireticuli]
MTITDPLIRVEKGHAGPEELAALTAVLLAVTATAGTEPDDLARHYRATARWGRHERADRSPGPRSWRTRPTGPGERS